MEFFRLFFESQDEKISRILDAGGCREGWLQGELYLFGKDLVGLQTNATAEKYDLFCTKHPMIGEIKICGGDYQPKMKSMIEADVAKLKSASAESEKFMILLVDARALDSELGRWLVSNPFPTQPCLQIDGKDHFIRIWAIDSKRKKT